MSQLEDVKIKSALKTVLIVSQRGNQYFQENKPWERAKDDKARCGIFDVFDVIHDLFFDASYSFYFQVQLSLLRVIL